MTPQGRGLMWASVTVISIGMAVRGWQQAGTAIIAHWDWDGFIQGIILGLILGRG